MAQLQISVSAKGAADLDALSRRLKAAGRGDLQKQLRREIRQAGKPVVTDLKRAVLAVDVDSTQGGTARPDRSTGLRSRTAAATGLSVTKAGVRLRTKAKRVDPEYPKLVKYLDGTLPRYGRWRHPVFGTTSRGTWTGPWAEQSGDPWFFVTIMRHRRQFRRAVFVAIEKANDKITSG